MIEKREVLYGLNDSGLNRSGINHVFKNVDSVERRAKSEPKPQSESWQVPVVWVGCTMTYLAIFEDMKRPTEGEFKVR